MRAYTLLAAVVGAVVSIQVSHAAHVIKDAGSYTTISTGGPITLIRPTEMAVCVPSELVLGRAPPPCHATTDSLSQFEFVSYQWLTVASPCR